MSRSIDISYNRLIDEVVLYSDSIDLPLVDDNHAIIVIGIIPSFAAGFRVGLFSRGYFHRSKQGYNNNDCE